jgi:hypothetical protein
LLAKSTRCFTEPEESFCGNLRVEGDEECDAGLLGSEDTDSCCDENCKLRANAKCSDKNSPCCVGKTEFESAYTSVFQPFSSRGTSQKFINIWRNLNAPHSTIYSIFREPSKKLAEPLGSAEPRLKNTGLHSTHLFYWARRISTLSLSQCYSDHSSKVYFLQLKHV